MTSEELCLRSLSNLRCISLVVTQSSKFVDLVANGQCSIVDIVTTCLEDLGCVYYNDSRASIAVDMQQQCNCSSIGNRLLLFGATVGLRLSVCPEWSACQQGKRHCTTRGRTHAPDSKIEVMVGNAGRK